MTSDVYKQRQTETNKQLKQTNEMDSLLLCSTHHQVELVVIDRFGSRQFGVISGGGVPVKRHVALTQLIRGRHVALDRKAGATVFCNHDPRAGDEWFPCKN